MIKRANAHHVHRFTYPTVRENVQPQAKPSQPPDRGAEAARQRPLVAASVMASTRRD
jgi:hypothetical protein